MAGKDPDDHRPRRAVGDSDRTDEASGSGSSRKPSGSSSAGSSRSGSGSSRGSSSSSRKRDVEPDRSTTILPRVRDDRSTTILPKTADRRRRSEFDDDEPDVRPLVRERSRMILIAAGVAAVVIIGLVLGYAALHGGKPTVQPSAGTSGATSTGATPSPTPVALLDDNSLINAQMARQIDPKRSWQVASTQHGLDANSPRAACFGSDPVDGQPDPQQVLQRLLSSSGQNPPALLHQAESYETSEDAAQAYVAISKALGTCAVVGSWIESGRTVNGLGDQSAGAVVTVTDSGKQTYHGMVVSRTGRVVDIVDVAQTGSAPSMGNTAGALAQAVDVQCTTSGGACAKKVSVKNGPPPLGGDEPGFLSAGDLPPVGSTPSLWVGSTPSAPDADYVGSGCETTDWTKVKGATAKTMRTYTQQNSSSIFGVDQIVETMPDENAASDLVAAVKKDLTSCSTRKLTATVSKPVKVDGPGAENNQVTGWAAGVSQKTASTTIQFRVGIVSVGDKVVWTLVNPVDKLDFTDDQWQTIVLRTGQRASQVQ